MLEKEEHSEWYALDTGHLLVNLGFPNFRFPDSWCSRYLFVGWINLKNIDLAKKLLKISKKKLYTVNKKVKIKFVKDRPGHDIRYALDNKKIKKKIGWEAKVSLEEGLSETFSWYFNNQNFFKSVSKKFYINRLGLKKWLKKELF